MKIQKSIDIAAPPEKIWPYLVEPEKIMQWFTLLRKFEYTSSKHSGAGATFYYEEKSGPMLMKLNFRVTEWLENKKLAFVLTSGMMKKDDQIWELKATPDGSRFIATEEIEMPWGIIGRAMVKLFIAGGVAKHMKEIMGNLKQVVEAEK
jgi:uncharacterized protein YndB with AHSA1/START domain